MLVAILILIVLQTLLLSGIATSLRELSSTRVITRPPNPNRN